MVHSSIREPARTPRLCPTSVPAIATRAGEAVRNALMTAVRAARGMSLHRLYDRGDDATVVRDGIHLRASPIAARGHFRGCVRARLSGGYRCDRFHGA